MSENNHIDKIFKEGIGEVKFSNVDAMWQKMENELESDDVKKKRPVGFFIMTSGALLITAFFGVKYFSTADKSIAAIETKSNIQTITNTPVNISRQVSDAAIVSKNNTASVNTSIAVKQPVSESNSGNLPGVITLNDAVNINIAATDIAITTLQDETTSMLAEKIAVDAEKITVPGWQNTNEIKSIALPKAVNTKTAVAGNNKKKFDKPSTITIEAVGGGDILRLNRKVGFYAGIRVNRLLEHGSLVSVGVNYASHTILDKYRLSSKPAEQRSSDAKINSISSIRVPVYLQRQMGKSKFAMMIGLVPTYITQAEVYNVPNSYVGDPNPYRKFTLEDINRFNLLFGAGIKYTVVKGIALELSGSYGLTGMVKDGYKNLSRVNDNFKSIQLGAAFQLK